MWSRGKTAGNYRNVGYLVDPVEGRRMSKQRIVTAMLDGADAWSPHDWETIERTGQANVERADRAFRARRLNADIDQIVADFMVCGPLVDLSFHELWAYAHHVSEGLPFPLAPYMGLGEEPTGGTRSF